MKKLLEYIYIYIYQINKWKEELLSSFFIPNSQRGGYKYLVASSEVVL